MDVRKEFEEIKTLVTIKWPFWASLLRRCRVIADPNIETAGVTAANEMRINPKFLARLDFKTKTHLYLHEAGHLALYHLQRKKDKDPQIFNIAADCVVNTILELSEFKRISFPSGIELVTSEILSRHLGIKEEKLRNLSAEEIYELLKKQPPSRMPKIIRDLPQQETQEKKEGPQEEYSKEAKTKQKEGKGKNQVVIQEGDPRLRGRKISDEEVKEYWKRALAQALVESKVAGKIPAGIERKVEEILRPKIDWRGLLRKEILDGLGRMVICDWRRRSRKHSELPGKKLLTKPTVWFLVDTSGSISKKELQRFFSEIYGILKIKAKGKVLPWDADVYPEIEIRKVSELLKVKERLRGGGGTVIKGALKKAINKMKSGEIVVVLTDGEIRDLAQAETQNLLRKLGWKSSKAIFATINPEVSLPLNWQKIKIEF